MLLFLKAARGRLQHPTINWEPMMKLNPYLTFNGDARAAFEFYAKVLRGQIMMMLTNGESPMRDHVPASAHQRIAHTRLVIGDQVLMASDGPAGETCDTRGMMVSLMVDSPAEAERIYSELSAGGKVTMPMAETFWAQRFGMFTDKFGIPWMVNCEKPMAA